MMVIEYSKTYQRQLLPLFAWAENGRRCTRPLAVSYVQRLGVRSPSVASLVAELAGLNVGADHD